MAPTIRWPSVGRRVRLLDLPGSQWRVVLSRVTDFRAGLRVYRSTDPYGVVQFRGRDPAVKSSSEKRPRLSRVFFCVCMVSVDAWGVAPGNRVRRGQVG